MKISFQVSGLPPKKDGSSSMWRKGSEFERLKVLRIASVRAMGDSPVITQTIHLSLVLFASPSEGDLDNFITGICDGLMAAHHQTPIDLALWQDIPEGAKPQQAICYRDDRQICRISAERFPPDDYGERYSLELEW
jgi:hypothetical protein